jgi:hypothetical protein
MAVSGVFTNDDRSTGSCSLIGYGRSLVRGPLGRLGRWQALELIGIG